MLSAFVSRPRSSHRPIRLGKGRLGICPRRPDIRGVRHLQDVLDVSCIERSSEIPYISVGCICNKRQAGHSPTPRLVDERQLNLPLGRKLDLLGNPAGVPKEIEFAPKWQIQLALIDQSRSWGVSGLPFVADAAYGDVGDFRRALNARDIQYVLEVAYTTYVWAPGTNPEPPFPKADGTMGRPRTRYKSGEHAPLGVAELARSQTE